MVKRRHLINFFSQREIRLQLWISKRIYDDKLFIQTQNSPVFLILKLVLDQ